MRDVLRKDVQFEGVAFERIKVELRLHDPRRCGDVDAKVRAFDFGRGDVLHHFGNEREGLGDARRVVARLRRDGERERDLGGRFARDAEVLAGEEFDLDRNGHLVAEPVLARNVERERKERFGSVAETHERARNDPFGQGELRRRSFEARRRRELELRREPRVARHPPVRVPAVAVLEHHRQSVEGLRRQGFVFGDELRAHLGSGRLLLGGFAEIDGRKPARVVCGPKGGARRTAKGGGNKALGARGNGHDGRVYQAYREIGIRSCPSSVEQDACASQGSALR